MSRPPFGSNFVTTTQISKGVPFVTLGGTFCNADRPRLAEAPILFLDQSLVQFQFLNALKAELVGLVK